MDHVRFDSSDSTLIIACAKGSPPSILYWGASLRADTSVAEIEQLSARQGMYGAADEALPLSLAMEPGLGHPVFHAFAAHREGQDWGSLFLVDRINRSDHGVSIECRDERTQLAIAYRVGFDPVTGVLTVFSTLTNEGDEVLYVNEMATACLNIPSHMTDIIGFSGRWTQEFAMQRHSRFAGTYLRENRSGRTSHFSYPAMLLATSEIDESEGEAYALHLAWSGNHRLRVDSLTDGRVVASLGALLFPGEVRLASGESFESPEIVAAFSSDGFSALSRKMHAHVRENLLRPAMRAKSRPVHYNSWEAVYFNHDLATLKDLASRAAALGVERFILDDGWFGGRRNDHAGLGDWVVSDAVYPDGLAPLVDHVTGLGMEFGLWFEPEMVNPDSDLFRAHPDWVLGIDGVEQVPFRNQRALDISRPEVADYLFDRIDALLSRYAISYIKWDMNRDVNHPGGADGRAAAFSQVTAFYDLLDRVRAAHPSLEIESCSSGGARADFGVLAHCDRVWTSDSNDALDRQQIQRGASYFLPPEIMGSHVGPARCHVTGRRLSMAFRAGTAFFGHLGLELNLLTERENDLAELKTAIALHKQHRALLHDGDLYRLDLPPHLLAHGVVARDKSEALFSHAYLAAEKDILPGRLRFPGLSPDKRYKLRLIWPVGWQSIKPPSVVDLLGKDCAIFSGDALMQSGLQMPAAWPETVLLFHLSAEAALEC